MRTSESNFDENLAQLLIIATVVKSNRNHYGEPRNVM